MTYCDNRSLREKMFMAYNTKASKGDNLDNREIIQNILRLRDERAKLLGYKRYADFVLEERMAENPDKVVKFLHELLEKSKPKAEEEVKELEELDRKSTRLNSSHVEMSYAVLGCKKKK